MYKYLIVLSVLLFIPDSDCREIRADQNRNCFRCHSMSTLAYRDSSSGLIKTLAVLPHDFAGSNHKNLLCTECHSTAFTKFPHDAQLKTQDLKCVNCHKDADKFKSFNFGQIEAEFKGSVHYTALNGKFTCFDCHDPHTFKLNARAGGSVKNTVSFDNQICLSCHTGTARIAGISGRVKPPLEVTHNWLPHFSMHISGVRCIDCHTAQGSGTSAVSHLVLPKEKALNDCVQCHSGNSVLMHSLYKYNRSKEHEQNGFINAVILNNSYVIGATRNKFLNILSLVIFGLVTAALSVHIYLRLKGRKNNV